MLVPKPHDALAAELGQVWRHYLSVSPVSEEVFLSEDP